MNAKPKQPPKTSWQIINSCLRIIRNGLRVKQVSPPSSRYHRREYTSSLSGSQIVDEAIDATSAQFNLRDEIEDLRMRAAAAKSADEKHQLVESGKLNDP